MDKSAGLLKSLLKELYRRPAAAVRAAPGVGARALTATSRARAAKGLYDAGRAAKEIYADW